MPLCGQSVVPTLYPSEEAGASCGHGSGSVVHLHLKRTREHTIQPMSAPWRPHEKEFICKIDVDLTIMESYLKPKAYIVVKYWENSYQC